MKAAQETLALAEEGFRSEEVTAGEAELAEAIAQQDLAQIHLDDSELHAPNAGVILTRIREPGSIVAQGEPVYTLSLQETVYVRAYVAEPDLGRIVGHPQGAYRCGAGKWQDSPEAVELAAAFGATRYFEVTPARDRREVAPQVIAGKLRGFVVIPQDFVRHLGALFRF